VRTRHCRKHLPSALVITLLLASLLSIISAQTGGHSSDIVENTIKISPSADIYAFGEYSRSQLKFDISGIPFGSNIISAKLWLYRFAADNWGGDITIYRVDDQPWGENITASGFDAQTLTNGENHANKFTTHGWDDLNVLNQVKVDHSAGHAYASFRVRWAGDDGKEPSVGIDDNRFLVIGSKLNNLSIFFNSKEFDGKDPYLEITYTLIYGVSASISPSYQSGLPGVTLNYTVTVKNEGIVMDAYSLTTADNAGWSRTISPSSLSLAAGASGTATLTVSISSGAENCTKDNVRVIATGTGVSVEISCIAHATAAPPPTLPPTGDNTPPLTPSLVSPADGANITDNTPLLDWSDVSDPSGVTYDLSIAGDAGFASIILQKTGLMVSNYELIPAEVLAASTYYWRVRTVDGAGNVGPWSEDWSFTVSTAPSPPVPVGIPLTTAIALLVVAMIAAIALYLIKRRKRHISGPRHGVLRRTHR